MRNFSKAIFSIQKYKPLILPNGGGLGYSHLNQHAINDVSISVVLFTTFVDFMKPPAVLEGFFFHLKPQRSFLILFILFVLVISITLQ